MFAARTRVLVVLCACPRRCMHWCRCQHLVLVCVVCVLTSISYACCDVGFLQMLWIHGQITPWATMRDLLLPSLISTAVPVWGMCANMQELQGPVTRPLTGSSYQQEQTKQRIGLAAASTPDAVHASSWQSPSLPAPSQVTAAVAAAAADEGLRLEVSNRDVLVLSVGLGALLFVPLFKYLTGLPPYMGMLSGLGILWMVTDALHFGESKQYPRVQDALRNVDIGELH